MSSVRRTVAKHNSAPDRLHGMLMELIRVAGLLQVEQAVPGHPISVSQVLALHELDFGGPLSQRDLAERLSLEKSTVSRLAAELERKGLLVRERDPANRRLYRLRLTDAGRAVHRGVAAGFDAQFVRWVGKLTDAERDGLLVGLPALIRVIRAASASPD